MRILLYFAAIMGFPLWMVPVILFFYWLASLAGITTLGLPNLFGDKGDSFLDIWSFQHFLVGIVLGFFIAEVAKDKSETLYTVVGVAYFWEGQEISGELGLGMFDLPPIAAATEWLGGVEHWSNRLIADPLLVTLGGILGWWFYTREYKRHYHVVLALAATFFALHVYAGHSMTIQQLWLTK